MLEIWRPVVGYEGLYLVSSQGKVRSLPRVATPGKILKYNVEDTGRRSVMLSSGGKTKRIYVARLVAEAFCGVPTGPQVRHWDGDCTNDRPENLRWGTDADNKADMVRHGSRKGEKHHLARLTEAQVLEIRKRADAGENQTKLGAEFGICQEAVSDIKRRKNWGWLK